jgi:hypothetical protein
VVNQYQMAVMMSGESRAHAIEEKAIAMGKDNTKHDQATAHPYPAATLVDGVRST